jgi:hypothetical protein
VIGAPEGAPYCGGNVAKREARFFMSIGPLFK